MANFSRIVKEINKSSMFDAAKPYISSAISWNQGDLIYFDTADQLLKPLTVEANATGAVGIADFAIISGRAVSPIQGTAVDAAQAIAEVPGPLFNVVARMKLTTGDTFTAGCLVYAAGTDPQMISSSGTKAIGIFNGPAVTSVPSGTEGEALLGHRYPADTLVIG